MNISIRHWRPEDKRELAAALNNKKILDNLRDGLPYPYTEADAAWYINEMLIADPNESFAFAIVLGTKVIGSIAVFRQQNIHSRVGELGYYIGEEHWGHGYTTEAVRQICQYVFQNSDIIRIFATPFDYNIGSCRVLEKAGFQYEGSLRRSAVKNGRVLDMRMYALLKED